jgi:hypothetical protein
MSLNVNSKITNYSDELLFHLKKIAPPQIAVDFQLFLNHVANTESFMILAPGESFNGDKFQGVLHETKFSFVEFGSAYHKVYCVSKFWMQAVFQELGANRVFYTYNLYNDSENYLLSNKLRLATALDVYNSEFQENILREVLEEFEAKFEKSTAEVLPSKKILELPSGFFDSTEYGENEFTLCLQEEVDALVQKLTHEYNTKMSILQKFGAIPDFETKLSK